MENLRAAVIGVGHLGRHHARNYAAMSGVTLAAVVDPCEKTGRKIARKYKAAYYADHRELPEDINIASIVTPTVSHHAIAMDLFARGIHCLVEKPMTATLAEAQALVKQAAKTGVVLQIGHIERFNPTLRAIASHLNNPRYITADRVSPFPFRSVDVSVIMDVMIHDIDLVLSMTGSDVTRVEAVGIPVISKTVDVVNARFRFANGAMATITASRVSIKTERKLRLFQPDAYMTLDLGEKQAKIFRKGRKLKEGFDPAQFDLGKLANLKAFLFGDLIRIEKIKIDEKEPLRAELEAFVHAVSTGSAPACTGEAGMKAIAVAEMVHEAIQREDIWPSDCK